MKAREKKLIDLLKKVRIELEDYLMDLPLDINWEDSDFGSVREAVVDTLEIFGED